MNPSGASWSAVDRARQMFFVDGTDPGVELAPGIRHSWQRCAGLSFHDDETGPMSNGELNARREAAARLRQCAQPELDGLAEHALRQGCVVILSDASGLILDEVGSPEFLPKAHRVALAPGADWSEGMRGTNAIGTVLLQREPLMVRGGEHYLARHGGLGCAAAPIFDARGELLGALDISGESVQVDVHALGLVRLAAAQLEHRLMTRHGEGQLLRFHLRPALLGTPREGLLSVQDGVIVGANRTALGLLGMDWNDALGTSAARIFGERWQRLQTAPGLVASEGGQQWAVAVGPAAADAPVRASRRPNTPDGPAVEVEQIEQVAPEAPDAIEPLLARAARVASQGIAVLVTGETGSGKEVFVRRLHRAGRRAGGPLVAVNCAALPDTLIEAELFGYEDGAFTGARRRGMPGRLREADGGTLFLDEIGDMPLALQTRLLRVLEERLVRPLGGRADVAVDFDLVCATHRDLAGLVAAGLFRADLLYRLQGYAVVIPPLRERADRRSLISRLFRDAAGDRGLSLSDAALSELADRPWPGNLRELLGTLRSLVALADDGATLELVDLDGGPVAALPVAPPSQGESAGLLSSLTEDAVRQAMARHHGNVTAAARELGLHRSTLYRHLAKKPA
ncbi:sigma-54-dependent Fis family transcriptional regulator [Xylophilus sp. GOD-11R]|uniref:sigma-54-dependent Fis family transcriptional regulator n=1 Tax=Xylophilus sp. GOD-11R TaxID=3089814 RepID=UPI00298C2B8E|nr:sigma-54-dependent Fis family transcriptional regulator [Xylophilus sp. GOD-11R]WPB58831.1 sigma-54-dependent Fis family transcriptional regulator [Xylophilus sp. GOD-11R]